MPGAAREYRQGIHEGVDFYGSDNCALIDLGTDVVAAKAGTVIRADRSYEDLTSEALAELMERVEQNGGDDAEVVDTFRGRQVWVDHGNGIVTRYAHLNRIADGIQVGTQVESGRVIAYVGESGTVASVSEPGTQMHLHFEIRIDESYLGRAVDSTTARRLYQQAFSP
ncbi:MAG: M23 family metallopeptidase [Chloroflexi bacterium]|nr:M23 family metallopeptidase [Chloroflexota bacterium]